MDMTLPPGQRAVEGFPRFGTHLHHPPPDVPLDLALEVGGALAEPFTVPLSELPALPRRELTADFHCVAGWSATGLRWEGVPFAAFYRERIEPALRPGAAIAAVVFAGLDGYRSTMALEDALADDVLLAEHLDGRPVGPDHGAPLRLVAPAHYGFVNIKHLCRIEVRTERPAEDVRTASAISRLGLSALGFKRHPRARVWEEERHGFLPARVVRPVYRALIPPLMALCARGSRERR
jgi:DMSO/TMAO reductase YedYZ molybdopterin-dependent catalytic subunit